jgi:hypothetical protein
MNIAGLLDRPIAFHRCFVDLAGSVTAALLLRQGIYWQRRCQRDDGFFWKTRDEWTDETGLGRREQETARKHLRATGVWFEEERGMPAKLFYRIDLVKLADMLGGIVPTSRAESAKQVGRKAPISEITAETTAEEPTPPDQDPPSEPLDLRARYRDGRPSIDPSKVLDPRARDVLRARLQVQ